MRRRCWAIGNLVLVTTGLALCAGCNLDSGGGQVSQSKGSNQNVASTDSGNSNQDGTPQSRPAIKTTRLSGSSSNRQASRDAQSLSEEAAIGSVTRVLSDYAQSEPTLVIWLFDRSSAANPIVSSLADELQDWYGDNQVPKRLETAIATYADEVEYILEAPVSDAAEVSQGLGKIRESDDPPGQTMRALEQILERYRSEREDNGKVVLVAVVTVGDGGDIEKADQVATLSRALTIPIFSIGYAAPFGRATVGDSKVSFGPETPTPEFVRFKPGGGGSLLMDSGFGPWALEYVSRAAGGTYLAIRPKANRFMMGGVFNESWPSEEAARFEAATMARFAPQYVPIQQYQELAQGNAAIAALIEVAERYDSIPILQSPAVQFSADDEARMKRELDSAQQPAALLSPVVNQVYERLKEGEVDRDKISQLRWKAAYDLALGQALAHVVRVDGYNGMLAQLKTGKSFQNKNSDVWVLEPANTIDTSSLMRSKLEQAQELLQGVIDDYPGTPWAFVAEQELKTPIGYEWKELDLDR